MDLKAQYILKEASLMPLFKAESIEKDVSKVHKLYQETYSNIIEKTQLYETQVIIWKQIDDSKYELERWLNETIDVLSTACECLDDAENGQSKLSKYREELPTQELVRQGILTKTEQLLKLNNGNEIPTLSTLNQTLDEQFKSVYGLAEKLDSMTSSFIEKENKIRQELKHTSDLISNVREEIIKCDDLTGDNNEILNRINLCKELKATLANCESNLQKSKENIDIISSEYPSILKSSLPKELQALKSRCDGVSNHVNKVSSLNIKIFRHKFCKFS